MIPINSDIPLYGVVGGMEVGILIDFVKLEKNYPFMKVGIRPNCDLNLLTDNVKRNIDVMFIKH